MPFASRLTLFGLAAAAALHVDAFVIPSSSSSTLRLPAPLAASSTSTSPEPPAAAAAPAPARLSPEEAAKRRAALKEALLQSLVASSSSASGKTSSSSPQQQQGVDPVLACPVTLQPLKPEVRLAGPFGEVRSLVTATGGYRYPATPVFLDLVAAEDRRVDLGALSWKPMQDIFRSPFTSFLYERGWRDNFKLSGFPGIDVEFQDLMAFMAPVDPARSTIVDLSCGSGLMARRLVQSGKWARVIAADFSESMLRETKGRFKQQGLPVPTLVRADAARLPFQSASLAAVHAGAALHCWPRLEESLQEVHRVLQPGGRFYASTFEVNPRLRSDTFRFFQLGELKALLEKSGFERVEVRREGTACLIAQCVKGGGGGGGKGAAQAQEAQQQQQP